MILRGGKYSFSSYQCHSSQGPGYYFSGGEGARVAAIRMDVLAVLCKNGV
jgi:hypothetical protein